jgi:hypothetical protein
MMPRIARASIAREILGALVVISAIIVVLSLEMVFSLWTAR